MSPVRFLMRLSVGLGISGMRLRHCEFWRCGRMNRYMLMPWRGLKDEIFLS